MPSNANLTAVEHALRRLYQQNVILREQAVATCDILDIPDARVFGTTRLPLPATPSPVPETGE